MLKREMGKVNGMPFEDPWRRKVTSPFFHVRFYIVAFSSLLFRENDSHLLVKHLVKQTCIKGRKKKGGKYNEKDPLKFSKKERKKKRCTRVGVL